MKRTNSVVRFFTQNRRLLLLLLLPLIGCAAGIALYAPLKEALPSEWVALVQLRPVARGVMGVFSQWLVSAFQPMCLLLFLFLIGLSAFGAPLVIAVPVFWGFGLGMSEAHYAAQGSKGWLVLAAVLLPHAVMELLPILMGCSESLRMTVKLTVQLFPRSARCGGLWQEFRLYMIRFLLLAALLLAAAAVDVVLRLLLNGIL